MKKFIEPIKAGDFEAVKLQLSEDSQLARTEGLSFETAKNPLYQSIENGHPKITQLLIEHGADVNFISYLDYTPLHAATEQGCLETTKMLIEHGAHETINNLASDFFYQFSPLYSAVKSENVALVDYLLNAGADPNLGYPQPLAGCAHHHDPLIAEKLINAGADIDGINANDPDVHPAPITFAIEAGNHEMTTWFIEQGAQVNALDNPENHELYPFASPLFNALINNDQALITLLLEHGADDLGWTPLHQAIVLHDAELFDRLVEQLDVAQLGHDKLNLPIQVYAAAFSDSTTLHKLSAAGITFTEQAIESEVSALEMSYVFNDLDALSTMINFNKGEAEANKAFSNLLTMAAINPELEGALDKVALILETGVDVNQPNEDGEYPLLLLTENAHEYPDVALAMTVQLIEAGADTAITSAEGKSALDMLKMNLIDENMVSRFETLLMPEAEIEVARTTIILPELLDPTEVVTNELEIKADTTTALSCAEETCDDILSIEDVLVTEAASEDAMVSTVDVESEYVEPPIDTIDAGETAEMTWYASIEQWWFGSNNNIDAH